MTGLAAVPGNGRRALDAGMDVPVVRDRMHTLVLRTVIRDHVHYEGASALTTAAVLGVSGRPT